VIVVNEFAPHELKQHEQLEPTGTLGTRARYEKVICIQQGRGERRHIKVPHEKPDLIIVEITPNGATGRKGPKKKPSSVTKGGGGGQGRGLRGSGACQVFLIPLVILPQLSVKGHAGRDMSKHAAKHARENLVFESTPLRERMQGLSMRINAHGRQHVRPIIAELVVEGGRAVVQVLL
jgi:hypothetical protein